jgi:hypothetical protein
MVSARQNQHIECSSLGPIARLAATQSGRPKLKGSTNSSLGCWCNDPHG